MQLVFKVVIKNEKYFSNITEHYLCVEGKKRHFRAHYLFWPKVVFWPKQLKPEKKCKKCGFSGNCLKLEMTLLSKRCFWDG